MRSFLYPLFIVSFCGLCRRYDMSITCSSESRMLRHSVFLCFDWSDSVLWL